MILLAVLCYGKYISQKTQHTTINRMLYARSELAHRIGRWRALLTA
jgi:hypothetical protein